MLGSSRAAGPASPVCSLCGIKPGLAGGFVMDVDPAFSAHHSLALCVCARVYVGMRVRARVCVCALCARDSVCLDKLLSAKNTNKNRPVDEVEEV